MTGWTNAEEAAVLAWYFKNVAKTPPPFLWISLFTAPGNDDGTFTEIAYTGYAREQVLATGWANAAEGDPSTISNNALITFGQMTGGAGGTATHWGAHTLETLGDMLFHGEITVPGGGLAVTVGVQPEFAIGALTARLGDLP